MAGTFSFIFFCSIPTGRPGQAAGRFACCLHRAFALVMFCSGLLRAVVLFFICSRRSLPADDTVCGAHFLRLLYCYCQDWSDGAVLWAVEGATHSGFLTDKDAASKSVLQQIFLTPRSVALTLSTALVCALIGTQASVSCFPVTVPQSTFGFYAPFQAVEFVQKNRPTGNLLNDPQFGDMLILSLGEKSGVFIDTRFDLYGAAFCRDYFTMANSLNGYEKLLESYKINWIFFPQMAPIVGTLRNNAAWKTVYQDNAAVIMIKESAHAQE
jgi:hypothetical protein